MLFLKKLFSWLLAFAFFVWAGVKFLLDYVGRSTFEDDWEQLVSEQLPEWQSWLFSTPWWMPGAIGGALALYMVYITWPEAIEEVTSNHASRDEFALLGYASQVKNARSLNAEMQGVLAGLLRGLAEKPEEMNIIYGPGSNEAMDFAVDIGEAFTQAKIKNSVFFPPLFDANPKDKGVKILHGSGPVPKDMAVKIQDVFAKVGILTELRDDEDRPDREPTIFVARA